MGQKVNKDGLVSHKNTFLGGSRHSNYLNIQDQQLCLDNNNHMEWSIQDEQSKQKQEEEILNKSYYSGSESSEKNQLALLRDIEIEKNLDSKVNSMYCNDYLSSEKNNQEIFRKLISQVN
jgi:hypothetical protein